MRLRLGLLSAARISERAAIVPAREVEDVDVVAVAARSAAAASDHAARFGIPRAHASYEALLDDPEVDAVYIATPASLHRPWAVAAIAAGKHVLVEKPIASNEQDATVLADAADEGGVVVMEAFHSRHHPIHDRIREVVASGDLGRVEEVRAAFTVPAGRIGRGDIRWDLALGGGAMMDLGVYPANWLAWVGRGFPRVVSATASGVVDGVDGALTADVRWPDGVRGRLHCSMIDPGTDVVRRLVVSGTHGVLEVDNPLAPQLGASMTVAAGCTRTVEPVDGASTYRLQLEAFRDAVLHGAPNVTSARAAVATMAFVDDCYRAAGLSPRPTWPSA